MIVNELEAGKVAYSLRLRGLKAANVSRRSETSGVALCMMLRLRCVRVLERGRFPEFR